MNAKSNFRRLKNYDDFKAFLETRTHALATLVATAMGKPVVEDHGVNELEFDTEGADVDVEYAEGEEAE